MNVHVLQHVPFEDIGSMASWLQARGIQPGYTRFFADTTLPDLDEKSLDLVIIMGGPMSVNDEAEFPWLRAEKTWVGEVIRRGVAVFGVCLGAQLIASALGARVFPNAEKEIGWWPIQAAAASGSTFQFPAEIPVFHWHGETFELPDGAIHLARSAACAHQAFQFGRRVIGVQFHLETTPESAGALLHHCRHELVNGCYIQSEDHIRAVEPQCYRQINPLLDDILLYLTGEDARPG